MFAWAVKEWVDPKFVAGRDGFATVDEALEDFNKSHWVGSSRPKYIAEDSKVVFEITSSGLVPSLKDLTVKLPKFK